MSHLSFVIVLLLIVCSPVLASENLTAMDWFTKGQEYDSIGQIVNSTSAYRHAVNVDPTFSEAWYNLGMALYAVSDKFDTFDEAWDCFEKAKGLDRRLNIWVGEDLTPMQVNSQSDWDYWREIHAK